MSTFAEITYITLKKALETKGFNEVTESVQIDLPSVSLFINKYGEVKVKVSRTSKVFKSSNKVKLFVKPVYLKTSLTFYKEDVKKLVKGTIAPSLIINS